MKSFLRLVTLASTAIGCLLVGPNSSRADYYVDGLGCYWEYLSGTQIVIGGAKDEPFPMREGTWTFLGCPPPQWPDEEGEGDISENDQRQGGGGTREISLGCANGSCPPPQQDGQDSKVAPGGLPCPSNDEEGGGSDPVDLANGSFWYEAEDLRIKGRGMDFVWARKYSSKSQIETRQGYAWESSYDVWLEEEGLDVRLHDGHQRDDLYFHQMDDEGLWLNRGSVRVIERDSASGELTVTFETGGRWVFHAFGTAAFAGKLKSIIDVHGNALTLQYDPTTGRLQTIIDTLDRPITIAYDANGFVETVTDFANRVVRYAYYTDADTLGSRGDLKSVTSPEVLGTPNGNDFPSGRTVTYTYSKGHSDPALNHNLLTITDGRRNDPADPTFGGAPWLTNTYGGGTAANAEYDRVVRQIWGTSSTQDSIEIHYDPLGAGTEFEPARRRVIVNDRAGNVKEYFFGFGWALDDPMSGGAANDLIRERHFTGRAVPDLPTTPTTNRPVAPIRTTDPAYYEMLYEYNSLHLVTRIVNANATEIHNTYEVDLDPGAPVRKRGVLRVRERQPGPYTPAVTIREEMEYEAELYGCACSAYATRHVDGRGNSTWFEFDDEGNRTKITHRIASIVEDFEYNDYGQLEARIHPDNGSGHRRRDAFTYYAAGPMRGYLESEIIDADGLALTTTYTYTSWGDVETIEDPRGNVTTRTVTALGEIVRVVSPPVSDVVTTPIATEYWYDANGNLTREEVENRGPDGTPRANARLAVTYAYGHLNERVWQSEEIDEDENAITEFLYDANRNLTLVRLPEAVATRQPDNVVRRLYDERDLLWRETRGEGGLDASTAQLDYDLVGNVQAFRIGLEDGERVRTLVHDAAGRLHSVTDALGNIWSWQYDLNGNVVAERLHGEVDDFPGATSNVLLAETTHVHDWMDREIERHERFVDLVTGQHLGRNGSAFADTYLAWTPSSQLETVTDDNGAVTELEYDTALRLRRILDAEGNERTYTLDANGNVTAMSTVDASDLGQPATTWSGAATFDNLNRRTSFTDPLNAQTKWQYDSRRNVVTFVDGRSNKTFYEYDGLDRLVETRQELRASGIGLGNLLDEIVTTQAWDDSSRLIAQSDDAGNTTTYVRDALGRSAIIEHADGTQDAFVWDAHGDLIESTDANGTVVIHQYDAVGRVRRRDATLAPVVDGAFTWEEFKYDGASRVRQALNGVATILRSYDSRGGLLRESSNGLTTASTHDGVGNPVGVTYPSGRVISRVFDGLNRPRVVSDGGGVIASLAYTGPVHLERITHANGVVVDYGYDLDRRPFSIVARDGIGTLLTQLSIGHDKEDNLTYRGDLRPGGLTIDPAHDSASRMVASARYRGTDPPVNVAYALDGTGNRETVTGGPDAGSYTMSAWLPDPADEQVNQYTTTPRGARTYDDNGNLLTFQEPAPFTRTLRYDYADRLRYHNDPATGESTQYYYDALGRLVQRTTWGPSPSSEKYYYDGERLIEIRDGATGAVRATFVHGRSLSEVLSMRRNGVDSTLIHDEQQSPIAATDSSGAVVERYEYDDYGRPHFFDGSGNALTASAIQLPFLFTGLHYDPFSGFYHAGARWLDPAAGRFISRDPIGAWGDPLSLGNGATYVGNNPWTWVDPYGYEGMDVTDFTRGLLSGTWSGLKNGLGGVWDTLKGAVTDPIDTAKGVYEGVKGLVEMLADGDLLEFAASLAPEVARLLFCWNEANDYNRGRMIGKALGTYGPDVLFSMLAGAGLAKFGVKALDTIGDMAKRMGFGKCSLLVGTLVLTPDGWIPIERLDVGSEIVAADDSGEACLAASEIVQAELTADGWPESAQVRVSVALSHSELLVGLTPDGAAFGMPEGGTFEGLSVVDALRPRSLAATSVGDRVIATVEHQALELVTLELSSGRQLSVTPTQRLLSETRNGWVRADLLRVGEELRTRSGSVEIVAIAWSTTDSAMVHDVDLEAGDAYYVTEDGIVCHNCDIKVGSYTIEFESGTKYHGKGPESRADASAKRVSEQHGDPVKSVEWKESANVREAFKDEDRRIQADGGIESSSNYNQINSPGRRYRQEDGEWP